MSTDFLLSSCGYRVLLAKNGPDALKSVEADPPDVVLMDIGLPRMDGWRVAQKIRSQTAGKQPIIIAVSGYGTTPDKLRSASEGLDGHLVKPVSPAELIGLLGEIQTSRVIKARNKSLFAS
ncbi:Chemotaxis protein methyltransferase CheR [Fimbriiglobus ruber]|uniref:Chemotaxis protein methyltransferase CheR n=2 Tax=Fimbriiglobus ruber TaxID=1908690 RepID=A0A225DG20_9BACT|nr:Chemotaxis protein methyltransferase CheR [Fimbriiglobus ruber]